MLHWRLGNPGQQNHWSSWKKAFSCHPVFWISLFSFLLPYRLQKLRFSSLSWVFSWLRCCRLNFRQSQYLRLQKFLISSAATGTEESAMIAADNAQAVLNRFFLIIFPPFLDVFCHLLQTESSMHYIDTFACSHMINPKVGIYVESIWNF